MHLLCWYYYYINSWNFRWWMFFMKLKPPYNQKKTKQLETQCLGCHSIYITPKKCISEFKILNQLSNCFEKVSLVLMMGLSKVTKNAPDVRQSNLPKREDKLKLLFNQSTLAPILPKLIWVVSSHLQTIFSNWFENAELVFQPGAL